MDKLPYVIKNANKPNTLACVGLFYNTLAVQGGHQLPVKWQ